MKTFLLALPLCLSLASGPVWSEDAHHPDEQKKTASGTVKSAAASSAKTDKVADKQQIPMQENMKKMQAQMAKIHQTTDPKERERLLQDHMQTMREAMQSMRGMGGGMMMGMMNGGMAGRSAQQNAAPGNNAMERRMDMMQMMMEQMMEHQKAVQEAPK
ncbi:MAG TPA: hypothetical protein VM532_08135 [Burkholderiales bacterium]|jgi:hypothetical protein|nr:hypothetical protein [Burkholderiales bacterium]